MWFLISTHKFPRFFMDDGQTVQIPSFDSNKESHDNTLLFSELTEAGVTGFVNKSDAKDFGLELKNGTWRYLYLGQIPPSKLVRDTSESRRIN